MDKHFFVSVLGGDHILQVSGYHYFLFIFIRLPRATFSTRNDLGLLLTTLLCLVFFPIGLSDFCHNGDPLKINSASLKFCIKYFINRGSQAVDCGRSWSSLSEVYE